MSSKNILKLMKDKEIEFVDFRFTDPRGKLQHLTMDATYNDLKNFELKFSKYISTIFLLS